MTATILLSVGLLCLLILNLALTYLLWQRKFDERGLLQVIQSGNERLERELRRELAETARDNRQEQVHTLGQFQSALVQHGAEAARGQAQQLDAFAQQLTLWEFSKHIAGQLGAC